MCVRVCTEQPNYVATCSLNLTFFAYFYLGQGKDTSPVIDELFDTFVKDSWNSYIISGVK